MTRLYRAKDGMAHFTFGGRLAVLGWTDLVFPLGPVRYREHEVCHVSRGVHARRAW